MGEPVTEERLRELAEAVQNSPEPLLRLIEAVGTVQKADAARSAEERTSYKPAGSAS